jgi:hypothetical protein
MADKLLGITETGRELQVPETELNLGGYGDYYKAQTPVAPTFEKAAKQQALTQFQKNKNEIEGTALKSAQEIQSQGQEMQTQLSLGSYMREQSAEKAGWTGGYMLDQARQGEFLKSTIQSQLYGAQELQKYGLDTQLEAARMAYDLGKEQLAFQYYNEAYQKALQESQLFGYYVSPENRDMLNQYQAAQKTLQTATPNTPEYTKAQGIVGKINEFYSTEGLTEADLRTFSNATLEMQAIMAGRFDAAMASLEDDPSKFLVKNSDGTYAADANGNYITLDFDEITSNDLVSYLASDDSGAATSGSAVKSFLRNLGQGTINGYLSSLGEDETGDGEGFMEWLEDNPNQIQGWIESLNLTPAQEANLKNELGQALTVNFSGPKGAISATFDLFEGTVNVAGRSPGGGGEEVLEGENPLTIPPSRTEGSVGWNEEENRFDVFDGENFVRANEEQINSYLNNWADDYKDLDGKKINWNDWYSQASSVADGTGWDWTTKDYINNFIRDQAYIESIKDGTIPNQFLDGTDGRSGWQEIALFAARQVPSQNKDDTQSFIKNMMSKMLSINPDDIEITTWSPSAFSNFPSIKIKKTVGREWLENDKTKELNGKYILYTQTNSGEDSTGYDIGGTGVNNRLFTTGTGLNNKWLGDRFGDYAYMIQQIFTQYRNRE